MGGEPAEAEAGSWKLEAGSFTEGRCRVCALVVVCLLWLEQSAVASLVRPESSARRPWMWTLCSLWPMQQALLRLQQLELPPLALLVLLAMQQALLRLQQLELPPLALLVLLAMALVRVLLRLGAASI